MRLPVQRLTERQFQAQVLELAAYTGWTFRYHTFDSRRSAAGFPDLVLARPPRLVFAELKADRGRTTGEQIAWLAALERCPGVEAYLWKPRDWDQIVRVLSAPLRPAPVSLTPPPVSFSVPAKPDGRRKT